VQAFRCRCSRQCRTVAQARRQQQAGSSPGRNQQVGISRTGYMLQAQSQKPETRSAGTKQTVLNSVWAEPSSKGSVPGQQPWSAVAGKSKAGREKCGGLPAGNWSESSPRAVAGRNPVVGRNL